MAPWAGKYKYTFSSRCSGLSMRMFLVLPSSLSYSGVWVSSSSTTPAPLLHYALQNSPLTCSFPLPPRDQLMPHASLPAYSISLLVVFSTVLSFLSPAMLSANLLRARNHSP